MAKRERNVFLEAGSEDESDDRATVDGYDSEEAENGLARIRGRKTGEIKGRKRRRLSPDSDSDEFDDDDKRMGDTQASTRAQSSTIPGDSLDKEDGDRNEAGEIEHLHLGSSQNHVEAVPKSPESKSKGKTSARSKRPGIIYLPSLPPHLKPTALKNLLQQRGFSPVTRLFLTPSSSPGSVSNSSKSRSRKSYAEGWVEFPSHKTAKRCVEALNATIIGGPKRGYYHDDLWNMRYLRGMTWADLMGQIREERREEEARKGEERRTIKREVEQFLRGVEKGKREQTRSAKEEKRKEKESHQAHPTDGDDGQVTEKARLRWDQFRAVRKGRGSINDLTTRDSRATDDIGVDENTRRVLGKIF